MKHLGDITKIDGTKITPVDVITFGAPCQDLSVAGKRAGMRHEANGDDETTRSGLFYDAIRIIKEMRKNDFHNGRATDALRCRYAIYENVPGALSSNQGRDWQAVLTAFARIIEPEAPDVPMPEGGWSTAGCFSGVGRSGVPFTVAWRIHDAQFWGVPQRRRRVCVLADFNGLTAPWILFDAQYERVSANGEPYKAVGDTGAERRSEVQRFGESLSGHPEPCGTARKGTAEGTESGVRDTGTISFQERAGCDGGVKASSSKPSEQEPYQPSTTSPSLSEEAVPIEGNGQRPSHRGAGIGVIGDPSFTLNGTEHHAVAYGICSYDSNAMKSGNPHSGVYKADTSRTLDLNGGDPSCNQGGVAVLDARGNGGEKYPLPSQEIIKIESQTTRQ